jgi:hypothetical protein
MDPLLFLGENGADTVTLIGLVNKKKGEYFEAAKKLSKGYRDVLKLEERLKKDCQALAKKFHDEKLNLSEFYREMTDSVFTSSLAAAMIGSKDEAILELVWPQIVGKMCSHLPKLYSAIKKAVDDGILVKSENFAEFDWEDIDSEDPDMDKSLETMVLHGPAALRDQIRNRPKQRMSRSELANLRLQEQMERQTRKPPIPQRIASWAGLANRLIRFIANPTYNFFQLSVFEVNRKAGMSQMRRHAIHDKRVCTDCLYYDDLGWQPIGELPLPGQECVCLDHCRCVVYYR